MFRYKIQIFRFLIGVVLLLGTSCRTDKHNTSGMDQYFSNLPFPMAPIALPRFPAYSVNIKDFGASGDGFANNASSINKAINVCSEAGGGKVIVSAGIWYTGPIKLKSNINLHLEKGAILLFSDKFEDYPLIETSWEGLPKVRCTSPISGRNLENIAITGEGVIDGAGNGWRPVLKYEMAELEWRKLVQSGGVLKDGYGTTVWWPSEEASRGREMVKSLESNKNTSIQDYAAAREYLRPVLVSLIGCKKVLLDGPTFQNSPSWNIHPLLCENMVIRNINVRNPWYATNGDGLDLESCKNVLVYNCTFDVGDDAICIKSGKDEYGRKRGASSENMVISDCIVYHGHGGLTIGSEMSGGVKNIYVQHCQFMGTEVGVRFKSTRGRGGVVENIFISGILMENIQTDAIRMNMFYDNTAASLEDGIEEPAGIIPQVTEATPEFRQIHVEDITCINAGRAIFLKGLAELAISKIEIKNTFISSQYGLVCIDAEEVELNNVDIKASDGYVYSFQNSRDVIIKNLSLPDNPALFLKLSGKRTDGIAFKGPDAQTLEQWVEFDDGVPASALINRAEPKTHHD